jgi:hypothetical protein
VAAVQGDADAGEDAARETAGVLRGVQLGQAMWRQVHAAQSHLRKAAGLCLLIACGACDEDDGGGDESSSTDIMIDEGSGDDTGSETPSPLDLEIERCGVLVDCAAERCELQRESYATCRKDNVNDHTACNDAMYEFEDCLGSCALPEDCTWTPGSDDGSSPIPGSPSNDPADCVGPYHSAWYASTHCLLEQPATCELDGAALCEDFY